MKGFEENDLLDEFFKIYEKRKGFKKERQRRIEHYRSNVRSNVADLERKISTGEYRPSYKGVLISSTKSDGEIKHRGITPLEPSDIIVQRLLLRHLSPKIETVLCTTPSYGRRKKAGETSRSPLQCCKDIAFIRSERHIFKSDFVDFFPSLDRPFLKSILARHVGTSTEWWTLLEVTVDTDSIPPSNASPSERERFWPQGKGVHQGTVLAAVFANLYMSEWDCRWMTRANLFRYIDDWLVIFRSGDDIEGVISEMIRTLPANIICHPEDTTKSKHYTPRDPVNFVGLQILPGGKICLPKEAIQSFSRICEAKAEGASDFINLYISLSRFKRGWCDYYKEAGLTDRDRKTVDNAVDEILRGWLCKNPKIAGSSQQSVILKLMRQHQVKPVSELVKIVEENIASGNESPESVSDILASVI